MKYYKDLNNQVFAYDSGEDRAKYGKPDLVEITEAEAMALANPAPNPEQLAIQIRSERDAKLQASTWLVERHREELEVGTTTLTAEQYAELLAYRQALRDITEQETFPNLVNWPTLPL